MSRFAAWLVCAFITVVVAVASAQPGAAKDVDAAAAIGLAKQAKDKYDQGEWKGALDLFDAAEARAHSPVLVLYAARCRRNLGELVEARRLFKRVADEPLGPSAPAPFREAQINAAADLAAIDKRIPVLIIDRRRAPDNWTVTVDGVAVSAPQLSLDPGRHRIEAGSGRFEREVALDEAARVTVIIEPSGASSGADASGGGDDAPMASEEVDFGASIGPGLITAGLGAAGLGVGVALRVLALNKVSGVKDRCDGNQCLAQDAAEVDSAVAFQTVSTVLFAVGGTAVAAGVVLMIVLPQGDDTPTTALELRPG